VLDLRVEGAHWGGREFSSLHLRWTPEGRAACLELLPGEDGMTPLLSWPVDAQGRNLERVTLPIGPEVPLADRLNGWEGLAGSERVFVMELLRRLPEIVSRSAARLDGMDLVELAQELMPLAEADLRELAARRGAGADISSSKSSPWLRRVGGKLRRSLKSGS
jgi:hypothetical protein